MQGLISDVCRQMITVRMNTAPWDGHTFAFGALCVHPVTWMANALSSSRASNSAARMLGALGAHFALIDN